MDKRPLAAGTVVTQDSRQEWLLIAAVVGLPLLVYLGSLSFGFVYDDEGQIVQNPFVQSWRYIPQFFTGHVWQNLFPQAPGNYYRPLNLLWFTLNHSLFGLRPAGWHAGSVLLHLVATLLVYFVIRKLTANALLAAVTALIFGVHPVHVEVACWISGATESLSAIPLLGAFLAYLHSRERPAWAAVSVLLYAVALLCKETAIVLPVIVFAHAWIYFEMPQGGRRFLRAFGSSLMYAPVLLAYLALRVVVLKGLGHATEQVSWTSVLLAWPSVLAFYVRHLVYPVGLSEFYDLTFVPRFDIPHVLLPLLLVLVVGAGLWLWQRRAHSREVRFALVWLVVPLLPLLDLAVFQRGDIVHDRYLYLPCLGFSLLVALALQRVAAGSRMRGSLPVRVVLAALLVAGALGLLSVYASGDWFDNLSLYSRGVKIAPHNSTARNNLANQLIDRGRFAEAQAQYQQVLEERPDFWLANYNLGYVNYRLGNLPEAEKYLARAIQINPTDPDQYAYLGLTYLKMGRSADAIRQLEQAIARKPQGAGYHAALGLILEDKGDCAEARVQFQAELAAHPENPTAQRGVSQCSPAPSAR